MKTDQAETKYGMWKIITVICVTYVQKDFLIRNAVIDKISIFHEIATKFHVFAKIIIFQV